MVKSHNPVKPSSQHCPAHSGNSMKAFQTRKWIHVRWGLKSLVWVRSTLRKMLCMGSWCHAPPFCLRGGSPDGRHYGNTCSGGPRESKPSWLFSPGSAQKRRVGCFGLLLRVRILHYQLIKICYTELRKLLALQTFDKQLVGSILAQVKVWLAVESLLLV